MSTVPTIVEGGISRITGLDERPVFFVTLGHRARPSLVVKGENASYDALDAAVSVKWASKMMKNVNNPLVNIKVLTAPEWRAFRRAATVTFHPGSRQQEYLRTGYVWVKMPFVADLWDADIVDTVPINEASSAKVASTAGLKRLLKQFLTEEAWRELGTVVAVDLFTGNTDRFDLQDARNVWVSNPGNIMFSRRWGVIGLDPYFADGGRGRDSAANLRQGQANPVHLQVLRDADKRSTFALSCVRAVGTYLQQLMDKQIKTVAKKERWVRPEMEYLTIPTGNPLDPARHIHRVDVPTMFDPFVQDFEAGLNEGIQRLQRYLLGKSQQYAQQEPVMGGHRGAAGPLRAIPPGVRERMEFLGWQ